MKFDLWKDIVSQSSYLKFWQDPVTLGGAGGNLESWKTLRVEGSRWNLVGKITTSPRYVIDITVTDPLSMGELGGGLILKNLKKWSIFNLRRSGRILIKFDFWNNIVSQSSHFKFPPDPVTLEGAGGNLKSWKRLGWRDRDETWWEK